MTPVLTIADITQIGVFAALAATFGYLLAPVPNIELLTATIFLAGLIAGKRNGCLAGMIAAFIFGLYNPWGPSPGPLLFAQVVVRGFTGYAGGWFATLNWQERTTWVRALYFGLAGFLLTSLYNVAAALSFVLPAGFTTGRLVAELVAGFLLISVATLSNVVIFSLALPAAAESLKRAAIFRASR